MNAGHHASGVELLPSLSSGYPFGNDMSRCSARKRSGLNIPGRDKVGSRTPHCLDASDPNSDRQGILKAKTEPENHPESFAYLQQEFQIRNTMENPFAVRTSLGPILLRDTETHSKFDKNEK